MSLTPRIFTASYPGITSARIYSVTASRSRGVTPDTLIVRVGGFAETPLFNGDLVINDSGRDSITFHDCALEAVEVARGGGSFGHVFTFFDRRWRWQFGSITGRYNIRKPDETLRREKNPRELATLLLDAMGEGTLGFNVDALPTDPRPEVEWRSSNPADALAALCAEFGCDVSLVDADESVKIVKVGAGTGLPTLADPYDVTIAGDFAQLPDRIGVETGPVLYESAFLLEAVGRQPGGAIVPIEDLSYKPADGWSEAIGGYFLGVTDDYYRSLAAADVFKLYRIKEVVGGGGTNELNPIGYDAAYDDVEEIEQLLPLRSTMAKQAYASGAKVIEQGAYVEGRWSDYKMMEKHPVPWSRRRDDFTLDGEQGLIRFRDPAFYLTVGNTIEPAKLYLVTSHTVENPATALPLTYTKYVNNSDPNAGTGDAIDVREKISLRYAIGFSINTSTGVPTAASDGDNKAEIDIEADYYLDALADEYATLASGEARWAGFHDVELSGDIPRITWDGGPGYMWTSASLNNETDPYLPDWRQARLEAKKRVEALNSSRRQSVLEVIGNGQVIV